ncbi:MAG: tetratricopeptide repeat protein [Rhodoblastus sp.]|nr:MAG: tetratricopeptide repeat protein [Rhodoblastus sp.]
MHLKEHDRLEEAQTTLRRIAEILARAHGPDSLKHAYALANLADATARRGDFAEAERMLARSHAIVAAAQGPQERRVEMLALLSNMRRLRGDARGALQAIGEAAELARALPQEKRSFGLKLMVDGSAAAALLDVGDDAQAWRLVREMTDAARRRRARTAPTSTRRCCSARRRRNGAGCSGGARADAAGGRAKPKHRPERPRLRAGLGEPDRPQRLAAGAGGRGAARRPGACGRREMIGQFPDL